MGVIYEPNLSFPKGNMSSTSIMTLEAFSSLFRHPDGSSVTFYDYHGVYCHRGEDGEEIIITDNCIREMINRQMYCVILMRNIITYDDIEVTWRQESGLPMAMYGVADTNRFAGIGNYSYTDSQFTTSVNGDQAEEYSALSYWVISPYGFAVASRVV